MLFQLWSCYSAFDASYADKQSFGYLIDVGNGFSTLIPTLLFAAGMTVQPAGAASTVLGSFPLPTWASARTLGVLGFLFFYQMFYGTVVYAFSFILNKR